MSTESSFDSIRGSQTRSPAARKLVNISLADWTWDPPHSIDRRRCSACREMSYGFLASSVRRLANASRACASSMSTWLKSEFRHVPIFFASVAFTRPHIYRLCFSLKKLVVFENGTL